MTEITGYPASDFLGPSPLRSLTDLMHPDDRRRAAEALLATAADGTVVELEDRIRRADGRGRKPLDEDGTQQRLIVALLTLRRAAKEARGTAAEPLVAEAVEHLEEGRDGAVVAEIADEGVGGASPAPGSGLADRIEALGGIFELSSPQAGGTAVRARVPLP